MKPCRTCKVVKELTEFRVYKRAKDGRHGTCKQCKREKAANRRSTVESKACSVCKEVKASCEFGVDSTMKDGLRAKCRACRKKEEHDAFAQLSIEEKKRHRQVILEWRKKNPAAYKAMYLRAGRKQRYGITQKEYDRLLEKQNHCCDICEQKETRMTNGKDVDSLAVDHDHSTGKVRGLLCGNCNKAVGSFLDNFELVEKAIQYVLDHQEVGHQ
jgi:hypothetical protein